MGRAAAAFLTFCLSLVDLAWNPASKSKAHDQAVAHYLRMNYEIRNLLSAGGVTREKVRWLQEEYLDAADLPRIPESQTLSLKRHHLQKLAIAQALEQNPHQALWWLLGLKLWWRGPGGPHPRAAAFASGIGESGPQAPITPLRLRVPRKKAPKGPFFEDHMVSLTLKVASSAFFTILALCRRWAELRTYCLASLYALLIARLVFFVARNGLARRRPLMAFLSWPA